MDVSAEMTYPDTTPDAVWSMILDPDFRTQVCEDTGALDYSIEIEEHDDGGATVTVERTMPADVPDFVKKFVGETIDIKHIETWRAPEADGSRSGEFHLDIVGQPAQMLGSMRLEADGTGAREAIDGELKVAVPFFGKKIEPEVAKAITLGLRQEQKTGRTWLAAH